MAHLWPAGLDAALQGCSLPDQAPTKPYPGQKIRVLGYPAGSRTLEERHGEVYIERDARSGVWIAQIHRPDEPVVTGMSGGPVVCKKTDQPIGILITRNSLTPLPIWIATKLPIKVAILSHCPRFGTY